MVVQHHDLWPTSEGYSDDCDCKLCRRVRNFEEKYGDYDRQIRKSAEIEVAEELGLHYEENTMAYVARGYQPQIKKPKDTGINRVLGPITIAMIVLANFTFITQSHSTIELIFVGILLNITLILFSVLTTWIDGLIWSLVKLPFAIRKEKKYEAQKSIADFIQGCRGSK
ncbi:Hypothetical protein KNT65_gp143 [Escherichia phage EcS1]|uniref:Uncharacterized protein n=1 Tax=Escherichia phage EcS1 TaxID=2083276 RepID=A0A2Z5ZCM1_9CAUD|nr:Hypothetical protein KNT65_gp143 [Escherichia phage EcS1]BBC78191.1 Hypothetical protein [Escherichia phage EcS1]